MIIPTGPFVEALNGSLNERSSEPTASAGARFGSTIARGSSSAIDVKIPTGFDK